MVLVELKIIPVAGQMVWRGFGGGLEGVWRGLLQGLCRVGGFFGGVLEGVLEGSCRVRPAAQPPLEAPKEQGTLVQRTCAKDLTRLRPWGLANFEFWFSIVF